MSAKSVYVGVDVGASRTKVAVLDASKTLVGYAVQKSGTDFTATADQCLALSLQMAGVSQSAIAHAISTGYGRKNVSFARDTRTEIGCHAGGCYHYFPLAITIIDIGGQDNKVIKLDEAGRRISFRMNRKCAAGTGAFLEEMSARLDIPLERMNDLAARSTDMVKLGSFCTVFSATEVLENIRHGKKIEDIVKGVFFSSGMMNPLSKRVLDLGHSIFEFRIFHSSILFRWIRSSRRAPHRWRRSAGVFPGPGSIVRCALPSFGRGAGCALPPRRS